MLAQLSVGTTAFDDKKTARKKSARLTKSPALTLDRSVQMFKPEDNFALEACCYIITVSLDNVVSLDDALPTSNLPKGLQGFSKPSIFKARVKLLSGGTVNENTGRRRVRGQEAA
jgi:hypothetical protein